MKKITILLFLLTVVLGVSAQNPSLARSVLDKTAAVVGNGNGASANFTFANAKAGTASGSIAIKGNKFYANIGKAIVWYNGKTQWSLLKSTNEVNVTTPNEAQKMRMNPYAFISMYKKGYTLGVTNKGANYEVHMTAQNKQAAVQEAYLTINRNSYVPSVVKMLEKGQWVTITISNFKTKSLPDGMFTFNSKDFPKAEVIDLR